MPKSFIIFNGQSSAKFGATIEELPQSSHAERRAEPYQIAGRNGSFVREDGTFENYEQAYTFNTRNITTQRDTYQTSRDIAAWLLGSSGYCRLEDTYEPEYYRLARFAGPFNVESVLRKYGRGTIVFDCQPERYLKSGAKWVTLFENVDLMRDSHGVSAMIRNPTPFDSAPLIRFTGTGSFVLLKPAQRVADAMQIGITLDNTDAQTIEIDCLTYAVNYVTIAAGVEVRTDASAAIRYLTTYPTLTRLAAGENIIRLEPYDVMHPAALSKFEIVPRWWTV